MVRNASGISVNCGAMRMHNRSRNALVTVFVAFVICQFNGGSIAFLHTRCPVNFSLVGRSSNPLAIADPICTAAQTDGGLGSIGGFDYNPELAQSVVDSLGRVWKLIEPTTASRMTAWGFYLLHQVSFSGL